MTASGATAAVTNRRDRLRGWMDHHRRVSLSTLKELLDSPLSSLMTWLVIGIALGLPTILYVVLQNVTLVSADWGGKPRISIYLGLEVSQEAGQAFADRVVMLEEVQEAGLVTADSALREFQERSGFGDVLSTLDRNPLPHVVEVVPSTADPIVLSNMVDQWEQQAVVDHVSVDLKWLERLAALVAFAERLVNALALVLAAGVVLIMGNTIRLSIENRRQEIEVIKLVGGTNGFVRRPFLYLGFWYGLGGALVALLLVMVSLQMLSRPVEMLAQSYRDDFALQGPGVPGVILLCASGRILGILGAMLAVSRHLSEIEPG